MRLYISKICRLFSKEQLPSTCYAYQWLPESLQQICDCEKFCKFPPKGNATIPILNYKQNKNKIKNNF